MLVFSNLYRLGVPVDEKCKTVLGDERMKVVKELKYLESVK